MSQQSITLALIASRRLNLIKELTVSCAKHKCNIQESRMTSLGDDQVICMQISGKWSDIAKLESNINKISNDDSVQLLLKNSEERSYDKGLMPYLVHVTTIDTTGIAASVIKFFTAQSVEIENMATHRYITTQTKTAMQTLSLTVLLPIDIHLADFREGFIEFCDEYNLDAILEPDRG